MSWYDGLMFTYRKRFGWTGYKQMKITIYRMEWTDRGVFGHLITSNGFDCVTLERMDTLIPTGTFKASFYESPKFKRTVLLLAVPGRSYIEIHPADYAKELEGCIALAARRKDVMNMTPDGFASDNNKATFSAFMEKLKGADEIYVSVQ